MTGLVSPLSLCYVGQHTDIHFRRSFLPDIRREGMTKAGCRQIGQMS
jgi:hypothetical protein